MVLPGSQPDKGELGPRLCCPVPVTMAVFVQSWAHTGAALGPWHGPQPSPLLLASRSEMVWEPGCLRKGSHGPHRPLPPSPGPHSCCPKACPDPTLHGTVRSEFRQKDGPVFCLKELFICGRWAPANYINVPLSSGFIRMKSPVTAVTALQHSLEGVQSGDQEWGALASGKNRQDGLLNS